MRILHIVPTVDEQTRSCGSLAVALAHCAQLRSRGHHVDVLAGWHGQGKPPRFLLGVPTFLFPTRRYWPTPAAPRISLRLLRWLRSHAESYDIIHVHLADDWLPYLAAGQLDRWGISYLVHSHGRLAALSHRRRISDHLLTLPVLRGCLAQIASDPAERDAIAEVTHAPGDVHIVGEALPIPMISQQGLIPDPMVDVVCVTRLRPDKNPHLFIQAAIELLQRGSNAQFTLIGPDEGAWPALERLIAQYPALAGRIRYTGPLAHEHVLSRIRRADIFVAPTTNNQRSIAMLEAMAAGVACVCTTDNRHALTMRSRRAATVVKPTVAGLAAGIAQLAGNPMARDEVARQGQRAVATAFNIEHAADALERIYRATMHRQLPHVCDTAHTPSTGCLTLPAITHSLVAPGSPSQPTTAALPQLARAARSIPHPSTASSTAGARAGGVGPSPLARADSLLWVAVDVTSSRLATWREIARTTRLRVALLAPSRANWRLQLDSAAEPFDVVQVRAPLVNDDLTQCAHYGATDTLRMLVQEGPSAVVLDGWTSPAFPACARWARRRGIPVVATFHTATPGEQPAVAQLRMLRHADTIVTSDQGAATLAELGIPSDRISQVPQQESAAAGVTGAATSATAPVSPAAGLVLDIREGHHYLFFGALDEPLTVESLLRAFYLARERHDELVIASDGPARIGARILAEQLGLGDVVHFIDEPTDLHRELLLQDSHCVVLLDQCDDIELATQAVDAGAQLVLPPQAPAQLRDLPATTLVSRAAGGLADALAISRHRWHHQTPPTVLAPRSPDRSEQLGHHAQAH